MSALTVRTQVDLPDGTILSAAIEIPEGATTRIEERNLAGDLIAGTTEPNPAQVAEATARAIKELLP